MARVIALAVLVVLAMLSMAPSGGLDAREGGHLQARDVPAPQRESAQPPMRRVAVGTATISGTVTTADTGRPVRGARVSASGVMAPPPRAGGPLAGPPVGASMPPLTVTFGLSQTGARGIPGEMPMQVSASSARTVLTDDLGNFVIEKLPAGQYSVTVSRTSFLNTSFGQKKPGGQGTTFPLADGQKATVNLQMIRGGVITGTVIGEDGDPLSNTQVRASRFVMNNGARRLQVSGSAQSDDRGVYRLFGLQPGEYVISSTPNASGMPQPDRALSDNALIAQAIASGNVHPGAAPGLPATVAIPVPDMQQVQNAGPPPGYLPVYHPGASAPASAAIVRVVGGDEHAGIDIQVRLVQASLIQGSVLNPPGQDMAVQVSLVTEDPLADAGFMNSTRSDTNGRFTFRSVAPGKYLVIAQVVPAPGPTVVNGVSMVRTAPPQLTDAQKWWGRAEVSVEGEPSVSTSVTLRPGRSISGQVIFEMTRPPDLTRTKQMVSIFSAPGVTMPSSGPMPQAEVGPDGRFTLNGIGPGRYTFRLPGGLAKSAIVNGEDTLDFPLDFKGDRDLTDVVLTVTDKTTEISGTLTDGLGKPGTDYWVIAVASDERFWTPGSRRISVSRTGADGRYMLRNLPPGSYLIAALTDFEQGAQYDPEFLKSLAAATSMRITVGEGAKVSQDLRVSR
jgi:hypothetical protein